MKWERKSISDICTLITSGGTPLTSMTSFYEPKEIPWLKTSEVNYCRIFDTENYISKEGLARSSAKMIPANSVIVAMYGQGDTAGRVAINKIPLSTNQACCNLIIDDNVADYNFVYYSLCTLYDYLVSQKTGGAQPNLNAKKIKQLQIPLPPLPTQRRIASILSAYDDLIENNRRQIKLLEEAAQRLYKEWFVDFRFPGYGNVRIVDGVPDGWEKVAISDLGNVITGKTPSTEKHEYYGGHIPFVKIPDMHNNVYPINTEMKLTDAGANTQPNKFIPKGSIIVSCIATVGLVNISVERCQTNQQINSLIPYKKNDLYYIFSSMKRLKDVLANMGSNGATMTNVNKAKFSKLLILYPPYNFRNKYFLFCKPIFQKIYDMSISNLNLIEARDRLLPKLMSGEIEV